MDYHCLTSVSATHLEQINALMKRLHGGARTLTFGDLGRIMTTSQIWVATKDGNIEAIALAAPSEFLTHHTVRICNLSRIEGCDLQIMRDLLHEMVRNLPTSYPNADIHISIPRTEKELSAYLQACLGFKETVLRTDFRLNRQK